MCPFDIIGVETQYVPTESLGELVELRVRFDYTSQPTSIWKESQEGHSDAKKDGKSNPTP